MIYLGLLVRDKVNGREGIALNRTEYSDGSRLVEVQPKGLKADGTPLEPFRVREEWLEMCDDRVIVGS